MRYARRTDVSADRSRTEIERLLSNYGADAFAYGTDASRAMVQFRLRNRLVKFVVPLPTEDECGSSPAGRTRSTAQILVAVEQETRQRWRALVLAIKAKLEAVESGIATFDQEFLPYLVLPDGRTVAEATLPALEAAYETGKMPRALLPGLPEAIHER